LIPHLIERGWDVTVLTVRGSSVEPSDDGLLALIPPQTTVLRTPCPEFARVAHRLAQIRPTGHTSAGAGDPTTGKPAPVMRNTRGNARSGRHGRLRRVAAAVSACLTFPDQAVGWFIPLLWRTSRLLSRDVEHVITSSPPHSTHLPILILRCIFRFRWVVDFRDPWTAPRRVKAGRLRLPVHRMLEALVLRRADEIVANTEGNRKILLDSFRFLDPERVHVITNGFDPGRVRDLADERRGASPPAHPDADLVYIGSVYPGMMKILIAALCVLRDRGQRLPRITVYGTFETEDERARIAGAGLEDQIVYCGRVSYTESIRVMYTAPALLLLLPHTERYAHCVPSKLYPYLFARRPVLAVIPDGDAADLLRRFGRGRVVTDSAADAVADAVDVFLSGDVASEAPRNTDLHRFTMDALAGQFDGLLRGHEKGLP